MKLSTFGLPFSSASATVAAVVLGLSGAAVAQPVVNQNVSQQELLAAQKAWCAALVDISQTFETKGIAAAKTLASKVIDQAYGYQMGAVLFKPTLANDEHTFRTTKAGALSYFVADDTNFKQDSGFALKNWTACDIDNAALFINGEMALTQGHVTVTNKAGQATTVDKTWGFKRDDAGQLRIVLHHSSLPYVAN